MNSLFNLCVKLLQWLGSTFHFTYVEISVIVNLWLQGTVLLASAVLPLWSAMRNDTASTAMRCITAGYFLMYAVGFAWMLWHYRLPYQRAFDTCVDDLENLAGKVHLTYNAVNIIIFVVLFLALIAANIYWAKNLTEI